MTAPTQNWGPASDDMPWDENPFQQPAQNLFEVDTKTPFDMQAYNQKLKYAYDIGMLKPAPKRKTINISQLPAYEQLDYKPPRKRGEGLGPKTDIDEAMTQLGYIVAGKLHRDISKVDRLIQPQSALDWLREKKLDQKGWTVTSEDYDNDVSTPNDTIVRNKQGKVYSIAGYRTTAPKKRFQTMLYEEANPTKQDRKRTSMKTWYDANVRPTKYVSPWNYFKKLVAQTLKGFGHRIQKVQEVGEDIHNKQRNAYTILPSVIWRDHFIKKLMPNFLTPEIANTYAQVDLSELDKNDPGKYKQVNDAAKAYFDSLFEYDPSGRLIRAPTQIDIEIAQAVKNAILSGKDKQNNFLFNVSELI
ncbi:MAG: hypothetical protein EZS28_002965 [Streblomastix strix]|uniref:Uncharacterized protein n=1 Tax=Streblomastix strix TaxID=222440 RepID=A0A5J4X2R7_9EUKA|nr:MAG: hypothetical protein EZS28_002965 [Streblomastix strix]